MRHRDISPLIVADYTQDLLIDTVRHFTGWNERSEVSEKTQLNYLFGYLESNHVNAQTVLIENEYVDRHFLEDYSKYYSRCFDYYSKTCARLHFFKHKFDEHSFIKALTENNATFIDELQKNYLGFAVIRPVPDTFIARLCLRPYSYFDDDINYKLVLTDLYPSLFGIKLNVKTAAFIEQDRVVSECATSAIWTLLSADVAPVKQEALPSLSTITLIASSSSNDGTKTFAAGGLTYKQVSNSLKHFDLEPNVLQVEDFKQLKELVYAYISNDIPILLGGEVLTSQNKSKSKSIYVNKGRHFTCVLGYHLSNDEVVYESHKIDKIYVHDDRIGPFVRVSADPSKVTYVDKNQKEIKVDALQISLYNGEKQYIKPEVLIIGLYHKIRLPYEVIKDFSLALGFYLSLTAKSITTTLKNDSPQHQPKTSHKEFLAKKNYFSSIVSGIDKLTGGQWDITLTTNMKIKQELIKSTDFYTFNGSDDKASVLIRSMPKYMWIVRVLNNNKKTADIILDATAVPQGNLIVGVFTYDKTSDLTWRYVEQQVRERGWQKLRLDEEFKSYESSIKPLFKFYSSIDGNQSLNALYGYLGLPRRSTKLGEVDEFNNIYIRTDVRTIRSNNNNWDFLDVSIKYIWVIDEFGNLVIGEDVKLEDSFGGHPTLIDNKPARLGGELIYKNNQWVVNLESGTYSKHIDKTSKKAEDYLNNVIQYNLQGLNVALPS